jgi:benzoyl-CoA reductase/2-hydroxyglutaryl-CoA dehydratase subunit BcrC/BadD/HgdB
MSEYLEMWKVMGLNIERHNQLLDVLPKIYGEVYLSQKNRPKAMEYFDFVISEIHGLRIKELMDHKAKGGKVFGAFCVYVPEELIIAAGGICVGLCGGSDFSIPFAEEILPRNLCPLIKSAFGFKLGGICPYFEACDLVIGETTCDGKKKTWEVFEDYVPMYVMNLPQCKDEEDRSLWLSQLYKFKNKVEEITSSKITPEKLKNAIELIDNRRMALQRMFDLRKADPAPISGLDALLVMQVSFYDDPVRFTQTVNSLCDELEERVKKGEGVFPKGNTRIMVSGSPMPVPNWKLPYIVEKGGAVIVVEESCIGTRSLTGQTELKNYDLDSMIKGIADRQLRTHCACFTPNQERIDDVISLAEEYKADGVIHYALQFCQPFSIEGVKMERSLEKSAIPILRIETDYGSEDIEQLRTRVEAFLEVIG